MAIEEKHPFLDSDEPGGVAVRARPQTKHTQKSEREYYADKASRVAIHHHRLGRVVAFIEVVSPGNKHDNESFDSFCEQVVDAIRSRIHVQVVDLFPPSRRDPLGIHKANFASYEADGVNTAYIETLAVGEPLPAMPQFIAPGAHILVPLEESYMQAWTDTPKSVRRLVE